MCSSLLYYCYYYFFFYGLIQVLFIHIILLHIDVILLIDWAAEVHDTHLEVHTIQVHIKLSIKLTNFGFAVVVLHKFRV